GASAGHSQTAIEPAQELDRAEPELLIERLRVVDDQPHLRPADSVAQAAEVAGEVAVTRADRMHTEVEAPRLAVEKQARNDPRIAALVVAARQLAQRAKRVVGAGERNREGAPPQARAPPPQIPGNLVEKLRRNQEARVDAVRCQAIVL